MRKQSSAWLVYIVFFAIMIAVFVFTGNSNRGVTTVSNTYYAQMLENGKVQSAVIEQNEEAPTGSVIFTTSDGGKYEVYTTDTAAAENQLISYDVEYSVNDVKTDPVVWIMTIIGIIFAIIIIFNVIGRGAGNNTNAKMMNFGRSKAKMTTSDKQKIRFDDVAGLEEEKQELEEIVDFLKSPEKYRMMGARIPKGVLLVGSPGTGKTLLAKAVAGEAGVPFFSISGSDFVEMFVGVGASRVRDLFDDAKRHHPCIVFIDEIDAVARRRGTGMGGGHDEREQTLNQLLVEMDGFGENEGIIVMAATNRVDILDPAIRRPGRFDRTVTVGVPDVKGREEILKVHAKDKPLSDDVDLKQIAQNTAGFTGADLENLMNEAAIRAAIGNRKFISNEDIKESFLKIGVGKEKKSKVISDEEKRITAYHEAGHAILFHVLPDMNPVYTISIIPTGMGAAGYTMPQMEKDNIFQTKGRMLQRIIVGLGGRAAEELVFDDVTTGASQDIKQVTAVARAMVTKFGMSEKIGMISYDDDSDEVFIGRDWGHTKSYSEQTASEIDEEVHGIIMRSYDKAKSLREEHRAVLDETARQLIEKEKLTRAQFEDIFKQLENEN